MVDQKPTDIEERTDAIASEVSGPVGGDCRQCCDQVLPTIKVYVRSFHPNAVFEETEHLLGKSMGGPWGGDNRGFTADLGATSRVMHSYSVNLQAIDNELNSIGRGQNFFKNSITPYAESGNSLAIGYNIEARYPVTVVRGVDMPRTSPYGPLYEVSGPQAHPDRRISSGGTWLLSRVVPEAKLVRRDVLLNQPCHKSITVVTHHFGVNLAVPMTDNMAGDFVPDLDVFAKINFDINKADGVLGIDAAIFGDQFPNCEAIIEDAVGTKVLLGGSVRIGYPVNWHGGSTLPGVQTLPMFFSDLEIKLNAQGNFESFNSGTPFDSWNTKISALDPNDRTHSVSFEQQ